MTVQDLLHYGTDAETLVRNLRRLCAVATDESRLNELDNDERNEVIDAASWINVILISAIKIAGRDSQEQA